MSSKPERANLPRGDQLSAPAVTLHVVATAGFPDYALLDSGDGRKL